MVVLAIVLAIAVIAIPAFVLMRRLRDDETVEGGSLGKQISGNKDDWGPKS